MKVLYPSLYPEEKDEARLQSQSCSIIIQVKELGPYPKGNGKTVQDFKQGSDKYIQVYVCKCLILLPKIVQRPENYSELSHHGIRTMYES